MSDERFTSGQAEQLLRRAAELQARQRGEEGEPTLSLGDLERLAAEAGISPAFVRQAARVPTSRRELGFLGWAETFEADLRVPMPAVQDAIAKSSLEVGGQAFTMMQGPSVTRMMVRRKSMYATFEAQGTGNGSKVRLRQSPFTAYFLGAHGPWLIALVAGVNLMAQGLMGWGIACLLLFTLLGFVLMDFFSKAGRRQAAQLWELMLSELASLPAEAPGTQATGTNQQDGDDDVRQNLQS